MRFTALLAAGMAAKPVIQGVSNVVPIEAQLVKIPQALADNPLPDGVDAIFAFYDQDPCASLPAYLNARRDSCYGHIKNIASWRLTSIREGCHAFILNDPCGSDNASTEMRTDNVCWQAKSDNVADLWVTCAEEVNPPPPPPPTRRARRNTD